MNRIQIQKQWQRNNIRITEEEVRRGDRHSLAGWGTMSESEDSKEMTEEKSNPSWSVDLDTPNAGNALSHFTLHIKVGMMYVYWGGIRHH